MKSFIIFISIFCFSFFVKATVLYSDSTIKITKKYTKSPIVITSIPQNAVDKNCSKMELVVSIIDEAIYSGAPIYNDGNHEACFKIYEGAAYKILHKYSKKCTETSEILETALEKITGNYNVTEKAWIMRMAFDKILGVPTQTK